MRNKGFTLIELMVVILIVAILAAVLTPMMTGRINAAKWTEGTAGASTIVTALRAYTAEHEGDTSGLAATLSGGTPGSFVPIGITDSDLAGKYFDASRYVATHATATAGTPPVTTQTITVTITGPTGFVPATKTLTVTVNSDGTATSVWTES